MATEEARAMLDALMGGERNAPLPRGAALPTNKRNNKEGGGGKLLLPGTRKKSCYDKDIDPLYTAWGVDVYDLFVNTKSDLGPNPYVVDAAAHEEFRSLSPPEQERLGYLYFLFQKLQELVRQCDRTVHRNKEKLAQEVQRKTSGRQDPFEVVDDDAVEMLARDMIQAEELTLELDGKLKELDEIVVKEEALKNELEPLLAAAQKAKEEAAKEEEGGTENNEKEGVNQTKEEEPAEVKAPDESKENEASSENKDDNNNSNNNSTQDKLQMELGRMTLEKQRVLFQLGGIMSQLGPLEEAVERQRRNLNYVKSDISTDKAVCDVSGNFMSSRDADERLAAHYAGKQYQGWKLVRTKLDEMIKQYGRYGPPPPSQQQQQAPPPEAAFRRGSFGRGGPGGGEYRRGPGGGRDGRGRYDDRGGPDRGGRWERNGRGGGGGPDRGGRWERNSGGGGYRSGPPRSGGWRR